MCGTKFCAERKIPEMIDEADYAIPLQIGECEG